MQTACRRGKIGRAKGDILLEYANLLFASVILPLSALALFFDRSAEYKNLILIVTSALFLLWGRPLLAGLVLLSWIVDFLLALGIEKLPRSKALLLGADILWNGAVFMLYMKPWLTGHLIKEAFILPCIAFYTLKNFSYVFDVFSGRCRAERNPFCLMTYSVAYPFLLAGPVVRYGDIEPQIRKRSFDTSLFSDGLCSYAAGLGKTVIILPVLTGLTDITLRADELTRGGAWLGTAAFIASAYVGFSGAADMGAGIARINGFDVKDNYQPISCESMAGSLVKSCNTTMIELFDDIRSFSGRKAVSLVMTVILGGAAGLFYGGGRIGVLMGALVGAWLAAEYLIGYEKIKAVPWVFRAVGALAVCLLIAAALAFKTPADCRAWFSALLGRGVSEGFGKGVGGYLMHNIFVIIAALVYISPLRTLAAAAAKKISEKNEKNYAAVQRLKTALLAAVMVISYLLLAAGKL